MFCCVLIIDVAYSKIGKFPKYKYIIKIKKYDFQYYELVLFYLYVFRQEYTRVTSANIYRFSYLNVLVSNWLKL